jgi:hypothetical protein
LFNLCQAASPLNGKIYYDVKKDTPPLRITGLYMLRRRGGSGYEKPQSACGLCAVFLRHILSALRLLRKRLFGPPKRHIQPERYVQYPLNGLKN